MDYDQNLEAEVNYNRYLNDWVRATHFAFERKEGFLIVSKWDLIHLVDSLVDKDTHVNSPKACMYKMYSRKKYGRDDLLSKIHPDDLYKIPYILVSKNAMNSTSRPVDSGTSSLKEEKEQDPWI